MLSRTTRSVLTTKTAAWSSRLRSSTSRPRRKAPCSPAMPRPGITASPTSPTSTTCSSSATSSTSPDATTAATSSARAASRAGSRRGTFRRRGTSTRNRSSAASQSAPTVPSPMPSCACLTRLWVTRLLPRTPCLSSARWSSGVLRPTIRRRVSECQVMVTRT